MIDGDGDGAGPSSGAAGGPAGTHADRRIGWARAIVETAAVAIVGVVVLVYGPNLILTRLTGISRPGRVALATAWFSVFLVGLAWGLRRLQRRHLI